MQHCAFQKQCNRTKNSNLAAWQGYLAALSASAYSYVSMLQRFGPLMNRGGAAVSMTYLASERIVPGAPHALHPANATL